MHSEPTSDYVKADGGVKGDSKVRSFDIEKNSDGPHWSAYGKEKDWDDNPQIIKEKYSSKDDDDEEDERINLLDYYEFRQKYGYFSILFSVAQTAILATMMIQCGVAPMNINPMVGPFPDVMSYWGAKNSYLILHENEKWRLLTPILLHAGILHLVGNVHVQMDFGVFCEKEWGSLAWLIVYLTSAVGSSIFSTYFKPNNISVGSSGAVMGLFGAKLAEILCKWCQEQVTQQDKIGHALRKRQLCMVIGGITVVMALSFIPYVDWAAHGGGCIAGFVIGVVVFSLSIRSLHWRVIWFTVGVAMTFAFFSITLSHMYSDIELMDALKDVCGYYKQFFDDYECRCVKE